MIFENNHFENTRIRMNSHLGSKLKSNEGSVCLEASLGPHSSFVRLSHMQNSSRPSAGPAQKMKRTHANTWYVQPSLALTHARTNSHTDTRTPVHTERGGESEGLFTLV